MFHNDAICEKAWEIGAHVDRDAMSRLAPPIIWKKALEGEVRKANPFSRDRCRLVSTGNAAAGWSDQIMSEDEAAEDLPPARVPGNPHAPPFRTRQRLRVVKYGGW